MWLLTDFPHVILTLAIVAAIIYCDGGGDDEKRRDDDDDDDDERSHANSYGYVFLDAHAKAGKGVVDTYVEARQKIEARAADMLDGRRRMSDKELEWLCRALFENAKDLFAPCTTIIVGGSHTHLVVDHVRRYTDDWPRKKKWMRITQSS